MGTDGAAMELWRRRGGDSDGAGVVVDSVSAMLCGGLVERNTRWKNFGPNESERENNNNNTRFDVHQKKLKIKQIRNGPSLLQLLLMFFSFGLSLSFSSNSDPLFFFTNLNQSNLKLMGVYESY